MVSCPHAIAGRGVGTQCRRAIASTLETGNLPLGKPATASTGNRAEFSNNR
jgi:hypothetical protein